MASRGGFAFVEDGVHLLGDGHLDAVLAGEAESGVGGEHAFGDLAAHGGENLRQLAAVAEFDCRRCGCGERRAGAGEHQVADAGEAGQGFAAAAAGDGEAGNLGDAAGDESGDGVVAEAEAVGRLRRRWRSRS